MSSGQRALLALVVLACALFAFRGVRKALRPKGSDFTIYYEAAQAAREGADPNAVEGYIYLPTFAVLSAPLAFLPYRAAAVFWMSVSLAALLFVAWRAAALASTELGRAPPWLVWLPLLLLLRLIDSNFANGQVNTFTLAAMVISFCHLRAGRDVRAGAWAGLAAAAKVVPAFLLLYFVLRGRLRAAAVGAATALCLVLLLPIPVLGWQLNLEALAGWWGSTAQPYLSGGEALVELKGRAVSQSLSASCYRLLCDTPATADGLRANLLELAPGTVRWIVRVISALHLLLFAWAVRARRRSGRSLGSAELGFALCTALLLAPLIHKGHMVWVLVAVTALVARFGADWRRARRAPAAWLTALGLAAIALTAPALVGRDAATWFLAHNTVLVGLELIWIALLLELRGPRGPADD